MGIDTIDWSRAKLYVWIAEDGQAWSVVAYSETEARKLCRDHLVPPGVLDSEPYVVVDKMLKEFEGEWGVAGRSGLPIGLNCEATGRLLLDYLFQERVHTWNTERD